MCQGERYGMRCRRTRCNLSVLRMSPVIGNSNQMCPGSRKSDCQPTGRTTRLPGGFSSGLARTLDLSQVADTLVIPYTGDRLRRGQDSDGCGGQSRSRTRDARTGCVHVFELPGPRKFSSVPCPRIQADRWPAQHLRIVQFAAGDNRVQAPTVFNALVHEETSIACSDNSPHAILSGRIPGNGTAVTNPLASPGLLDCRTMSICGPKKPEGTRIPGMSDLSRPDMPGQSS